MLVENVPQVHYEKCHTVLSDKERNLGIITTSSLKSSEHVARATASANSMLGRMKHTFTSLYQENILAL